ALRAARLADPEVAGALRERLGDPDREVRAEAARWLGGAGAATLAAMLQSSDREDALAGLHAFDGDGAADGASLVSSMASRVADPDPRLRAAALAALACVAPDALAPDPLQSRPVDADAHVRRAAVRVLARRDGAGVEPVLARALRDGSRDVRGEAVCALAARGEAGVEAARAQLHAPEEFAVGAALRVLGGADSPRARGLLRAEYA